MPFPLINKFKPADLFHRYEEKNRNRKYRKKDLIVTIHGFGTRLSSEMDPLKSFLNSEGYEVITFDIYDYSNPEDTDFRKWINRCEQVMSRAVKDGRPVTLIGFSMGGVIASYLASIYPVRQLILCAPAFHPFDLSKLQKMGKNMVSSSDRSSPSMSSEQTQAFINIVTSYRNSIEHVECPVLMIHGTEDEVIQPRSSRKAYEILPSSKKRLIYLEGAKHRFLYDGVMEKTAFSLIRDMLEDRIF